MPESIQTGHVIRNRYEVIETIGRGGMGVVYMARDTLLAYPVALKVAVANNSEEEGAFRREAQLLTHLEHAALPRVTAFFHEGGRQFIVMDFITGVDLKKKLALRGHPFECAEVLAWADQILDALVYLHAQPTPVIHRDIKPSNLKLTPEGKIVLLDFGIAKGRAGPMDAEQALESLPRQTLPYAPPEQSMRRGTDQRSDLFSLSATVYHLMTNELAHYAEQRMWETWSGRPDPLKLACAVNDGVPVAVAEVLHRGLALNPDERPQTAVEMREALRTAGCA
jgi:serine/threonine protein kinase